MCHSRSASQRTAIEGKVYDLSSFVASHPGGDLIAFAGGKDASALFSSYHLEPYVREKVLPKYLIGELDLATAPPEARIGWDTHSPFYEDLKADVRDTLRHQHSLVAATKRRQIVESFFVSLALTVAWLLTYVFGFLFLAPLVAFSRFLFLVKCGHDLGHSTMPLFRNIIGRTLFRGIGEVMGASYFAWVTSHNLGHHVYSNTEFDPDARIGYPYLRFHPILEKVPLQKYQHLFSWLLYGVTFWQWPLKDAIEFYAQDPLNYIQPDLSETLIFYAAKSVYFVMFALPMFLWGLPGFCALAVDLTLASLMVSLQFVTTHISAKAEFVKAEQKKDWAKLQVETSTNYAVDSPLATWLSGGLNFQIEHHLFPSIPHSLFPLISPLVRKHCEKHNVRYYAHKNYWHSLKAHYDHLRNQSLEVAAAQNHAHSRTLIN